MTTAVLNSRPPVGRDRVGRRIPLAEPTPVASILHRAVEAARRGSRTRRREGTATARGTRWATTRPCTWANARVTEGAVSVRNLRTVRSVPAHAGDRYRAGRRR